MSERALQRGKSKAGRRPPRGAGRLELLLSGVAMAFVLLACSSSKAPASDAAVPPADLTMKSPPGGSGGARAVKIVGPMRDAQVDCTEGGSPDDEFSVPCADPRPVDAGMDAGEVVKPLPDAGDPGPREADASVPFDAGLDASLPPTPDEGMCAMQGDSCQFGHAATVVGSATCTIAGDSLYVERQICEACSKSTDLVDFSLTVMDCGSCAQVYSEGYANQDIALAADACIMRSESAGLAWSAADPRCVDVYAYVGSGIADINGWTMQSGDQVRVCRCDRTTDTCTNCMNGACDKVP